MKKLVIAGTFLLTASLLVGGIYYPDTPLMWLASTGMGFTAIRVMLLALLATLFFTRPPRPIILRAIIGGAAAGLLIVVYWLTRTYMINIIDTVVLTEVAIIGGIEALESQPLSVVRRTAAHKKATA